MNTRSKVILDEWFGKTAVVLLNVIARILGRVLSIDHSLKPPKRIVVCKFLGMGSIIQATPLLQSLRKSFPSAQIIFITSVSNVKLLESINVIDKVYYINDKGAGKIISTTLLILSKLWKRRADLYIDLETYSFYSTALATLSCATNRFGFYRIERNIRMGVYTHMMFFNARAPIAQSYLQMGRLAGCNVIIEDLYKFKIDEADLETLHQKLKAITGEQNPKYVIVNPNASDLRIERRWPANKFVSLIELLRRRYPEKIFLLIGAANEMEWVNSIWEKLDASTREKVFNTAGKFSLHELFALIAESELVITNDTGPMHISFAFGRPTISLFGPASPLQYGNNRNAFGIYKNIYCSPCVHDFLTPPCKGDNQCMKKIEVDEVAELSKLIFSKIDASGGIDMPPMDYLKMNNSTLGILERNKSESDD